MNLNLLKLINDPNWLGKLFGKTEETVLVLGPRNSGKSWIITGIHRASVVEKQLFLAKGIDLWIGPESESTGREWVAYDQALISGKIPIASTAGVAPQRFRLEANYRGKLPLTRHRYTQKFDIPDRPGSDGFPDGINGQINKEIIELLMLKPSGVIYCVDPTAANMAQLYHFHFLHLLTKKIKLRRIVFALTKADAVFLDDEAPYSACLEVSPEVKLKSKLGRQVLEEAKLVCDASKIAAVWTSVHGFLPDGKANFTRGPFKCDDGQFRNDERLLKCVNNGCDFAEANDDWCPYQLLSPFLYIAAGNAPGVFPVF